MNRHKRANVNEIEPTRVAFELNLSKHFNITLLLNNYNINGICF